MGKKYCIFAAQYLPHMGGVERYTYNLSKKLIEAGDEVVVVTSNTENLPYYETVDGIQIYRFPCYNLLGGRYPVICFNKQFRKIHRRLMRYSYDMVLINTRFYIHSLYGVWFAKRKKVRCITIDHGTSHLSVHNVILDKVGAAYEHGITGIVKHYCKEFYGVSKACNEWLAHFHIASKGVLYNAIDLEHIEYCLNNAKRDFRKEYKIPNDAFVIAFTGRLIKEKGIYTLIEAIEKLLNKYPQIFIMLAGEGEEMDYVRRHASNHVIPLGYLEFPDVIAMLKQSEVFCLPSFSEGFPTSVLEAAVCGCYIITTERGGAKEFITDGSYGTIIPDSGTEYIYEALETVINNEESRKKAVDRTYKRIKENYTWNITAEKVRGL